MTLLAVVFAISTAWADATLPGSGTIDDPFVISSAEDWNTFASNVNSGVSFSGQFVKLDADIIVSTMVGTKDNKFCGTFNGSGHKLTFNLGASDNQFSDDYAAPFRYVDGATITRLHVAGDIYTSKRYVGGLLSDPTGKCTISNCRVSVTIRSSFDGDGTDGGFVGLNNSSDADLTFTNCVFDGQLLGSSTHSCGGFVGWHNSPVHFDNCLFAPSAAITIGTKNSATFSRNGITSINNSYYKTAFNDAQGTDGSDKSLEDLASDLGGGITLVDGILVPVTTAFDLSVDAVISGIPEFYAYTGSSISLDYIVVDGNYNTLTSGSDYNASITKNDESVSEIKETGTYTLTIEGTGSYNGTISKTFLVINSLNKDADGNFLIGSVDDWTTFVNSVSSGATYEGETVKLTESITISTMAGDADHQFCGTFDGGSKTLTLDLNDGGNKYCAPFRYVNAAKFQNLVVAGTITATKEGDGTHGGFVGISNGATSFEKCIFKGKMLGDNTNSCGGFVGYANAAVTFTDCLFDPTEMTVGKTGSASFDRGGKGSTYTNCYCTSVFGAQQGVFVYANESDVPQGAPSESATACDNQTYYYIKCPDGLYHDGEIEYGEPGFYYVNMPPAGTTSSLTLDGSVRTFKVYDASGKTEKTKGEDAFLEINAPGYVINLTEGNISNNVYLYVNSSPYKELFRLLFKGAVPNRSNSEYFKFCIFSWGSGGDLDLTITLGYSIAYELNGGAMPEGVSNPTFYNEDFETITLNNPINTKDNYSFEGWYDNPQFTGEAITEIAKGSTGNKTLYAKWDVPSLTKEDGSYIIANEGDWTTFVNNIAYGLTTYEGETVKLTNSITISTMAGDADHQFAGTFDGGKNTLTLEFNDGGKQFCAPFSYVNGATFRNLIVDGTITATISGDGTHGGFVGVSNGATVFDNCAFKGSLLGENANSCGGFVGYAKSAVSFSDCLFAPAEITMSESKSATFNRGSSSTFTRCYFTKAFGSQQGIIAYANENDIPDGASYTEIKPIDGNTYYYCCLQKDANGNYLIQCDYDWTTFVNSISSGTTYKDETVKLTKSIAISTMAGDADHQFCGTFDGGKNTLILELNDGGNKYCAPFSYANGATFRNLIVDGTITATISGDGTHGGFVGISNGATVFENCAFKGSMSSENSTTNSCGGFVGYANAAVTFTDCLFAPASMSVGLTNCATFNRGNSSTLSNCTYTHCYYTSAFGTEQGVLAYDDENKVPEGMAHTEFKAIDGNTYYYCCYTITSEDEWIAFVNSIASGETFKDKLVVLTNSITISTMAGSEAHPFSGTFDGGGNTLTLALNDGGNKYCAPFSCTKDATIQYLIVDGTITATREGDGTHGGFVGLSNGSATFKNCAFKGSILGDKTTSCGGFVGWAGSAVSFTNCLFAPTKITVSDASSSTFNRGSGSTYTNCYFTGSLGAEQGDLVFANLSDIPEGVSYTAITAVDKKTYYLAPGVYSIAYNPGEGATFSTDKNSYTVESATFTLDEPTKTGYIFGGWFDNAQLTGDPITEIAQGSTGNKKLYAKWTAEVYNITYNNVVGANFNPTKTSYTVEDETFALEVPTKEGYTFEGWLDENEKAITEIAKGSIGDMKLYADWTVEVYAITYVLDGGEMPEGVSNPATYTVEDETITLNNPARNGYKFGGWVDEKGNVIKEIAKGSIGDMKLYADWINIKSISDASVAAIPDQEWSGSDIEPALTITDGDYVLQKDVDYTVEYSNNNNTGIATVTIIGIGNYNSEISGITFNIVAKETIISGGLSIFEDQDGKIAKFANGSAEIKITEPITVNSVELARTFTPDAEGNYSRVTMMLPFAAKSTEYTGGTFYEFTSVAPDENGKWVASLTKVAGNLAANTPYLFVPSADKLTFKFEESVELQPTSEVVESAKTEDGWVFKGVYKRQTWGEDNTKPDYFFTSRATTATNGVNVAAGDFVRIGKNCGLNPMRCYLTYDGEDKTLQKTAFVLPESIEVRLIDEVAAVVEPVTEPENTGDDIKTPVSEILPVASVKVWSYDKTIFIQTQPGTSYRIVDVSGRVLKDGVTNTSRDEIRLGIRGGIVIVIINGKSYKVSY